MHLSESARRTWESRPKAIIDRLMFGVRRCLCIYQFEDPTFYLHVSILPKQCHIPHITCTDFDSRIFNPTPTSTPLHHPLPLASSAPPLSLRPQILPSNPPSTSPTPRQTPPLNWTSHPEPNPTQAPRDKRPFPSTNSFHHIVQLELRTCAKRRPFST